MSFLGDFIEQYGTREAPRQEPPAAAAPPPTGPNDAQGDRDGDGLTNEFENADHNVGGKWQHSFADDPDSDDDGLGDAEEYAEGSNPTNPDSDRDGRTDGQEVYVDHTDPTRGDTDGDGLADGDEADYGGDPNDRDTDDDGLTDGREARYRTDVANADTDGDGLRDGLELDVLHTSPIRVDTDGDGFSDADEYRSGGDPTQHEFLDAVDGDQVGADAIAPYQPPAAVETDIPDGIAGTDPGAGEGAGFGGSVLAPDPSVFDDVTVDGISGDGALGGPDTFAGPVGEAALGGPDTFGATDAPDFGSGDAGIGDFGLVTADAVAPDDGVLAVAPDDATGGSALGNEPGAEVAVLAIDDVPPPEEQFSADDGDGAVLDLDAVEADALDDAFALDDFAQ
jgi:hypothetical protein